MLIPLSSRYPMNHWQERAKPSSCALPMLSTAGHTARLRLYMQLNKRLLCVRQFTGTLLSNDIKRFCIPSFPNFKIVRHPLFNFNCLCLVKKIWGYPCFCKCRNLASKRWHDLPQSAEPLCNREGFAHTALALNLKCGEHISSSYKDEFVPARSSSRSRGDHRK